MTAHQQAMRSATAAFQRQTHAVPHVDTICSSTGPSAERVESFTNVQNLVTTSDDAAALLRELGPLKFVGNLVLPAEVLHGQQGKVTLKPAQMPGSVTQERILSTGVNSIPSTCSAPVGLSNRACGQVPTHSQNSSFRYTREEYLRRMEHHRYMASYYRELQSQAKSIPERRMESVCPRETGGIHDRSWDEEKRPWDDGTGGVVLPDDAVEKLDAIPGILDVAREMGFITLC
ncbi:hypothetical protein ACEWY4_010582 [Coilia grayii]|uniref:Uncharacterized protein n=1 Tax=Coilia grayii TaxID=363190 RepID=A0ABD1K2D0_9TELE